MRLQINSRERSDEESDHDCCNGIQLLTPYALVNGVQPHVLFLAEDVALLARLISQWRYICVNTPLSNFGSYV